MCLWPSFGLLVIALPLHMAYLLYAYGLAIGLPIIALPLHMAFLLYAYGLLLAYGPDIGILLIT